MLIDTHAHLDLLSSNIERVIENAKESDLRNIITVVTDISSSYEALKIAQKYDFVSASCGIHPHNAEKFNNIYDQLQPLLEKPEAAAVGETGLDYHYLNSPSEDQKSLFREHLLIARDFEMPIIIHNRDADHDTLEILKDEAPFDKGGVMHCFSGDKDMVKECLDLGFYIAAGGIVTFKGAVEMQEVFKRYVPLDRLVLETDAPYLTPAPNRGKKNEPAYVRYVAQKIAELKSLDIDLVKEKTTKNAVSLFRL